MRSNMRPLLLAGGLMTLLGSASSFGSEAILIGGGYGIQSSQGQIELNVKWVQSVLETRGMTVDTYFTDGDETGPDVHYHLAPRDTTSRIEPLARAFGDWILENRRYREHTVPRVLGSTRRNELEPQLQQIIERTSAQDLLLVYNGHGSQSLTTPDRVTMNLWDDTTLTANELHGLLEPRSAPFRFVFTQCYSGGFHRLAYENPAEGIALHQTSRCGFTAESAYRLAEGCSASVDTDDYRDYTTYFFAALSGQTRNGEPVGEPVGEAIGDAVSRSPDINEDGITTLREAHLFTLGEAFSTDLSRSTSEDYLSQWQPWYLRWLPPPVDLPDNEYAQLFRESAGKYGIAADAMSGETIRQKLTMSERQQLELVEQRYLLENTVEHLQYKLQHAVHRQWPELLGPYTGAYQTLAENGTLLTIADEVKDMPDYAELVSAQTRFADLDLEILHQERLSTQLQKLVRFRHLALLKQQIAEYGSNREQLDYHSLVACEDVPLTTPPAID